MNFNNLHKLFYKFAFLTSLLLLTNQCGIWDPADARKVPVNAKDRVAKNIEEGRAIKFSKLGKGGGSLVQQGLIIALGGSVSAVVPYVGVILMGIIALWMIAARSLGKQFAQASAKTQEDKKSEVEEVVVAPPQNTAREAQTTS